jgi:tetratricopeptide (TPR) repeat protein/transcriptional regulator with XRE-family HTH domain
VSVATSSFSSLLRALRTESGLTQEEVADRAGLSARAIGDLERGAVRRPQRKTVELLIRALELPAPVANNLSEVARRSARPDPGPVDAPEPEAPAVPRQLPIAVQHFTGRQSQLAALEQWSGPPPGTGAAAVRVLAIDGMAGVGKTALATELGHRLTARYPDGQLFLDLHGHTPGRAPVSLQAALVRLLRAIGVSEERLVGDPDGLAELWRSEAAGRRLLIVLDDASDAEHVRSLIPGQGGSLVLVTSRLELGDLDTTGNLSLGVLPDAEASELFLRDAGDREEAAGIGTGADPRAEIGEVVQRCGHLPLAIRIAAARLRHRPSWGIADLAAKLAESAADDRDQVAAAFEMSYTRLDAEQQRMFRMLGLHPGTDIDVFAAAALAGLPVRTAGRQLESLLSHHLIEQYKPGRYTFHDLMREYARGKSGSTDESPAEWNAQSRLLDHYAYTAAEAVELIRPGSRRRWPSIDRPDTEAPHLADADAALDWLEAERADLLAAAALAVEQGRPSRAVLFSQILWHHLYSRGHHLDALALHTLAADAARAGGDNKGLAHAQRFYGLTCYQLGRPEDALTALIEARDLCEDRLDLASAVEALGNLAMGRGSYAEAIEHYEQSLGLWRSEGHTLGIGNDLCNLGVAYLRLGDYPAARRLTSEALDIDVAHGLATAEPQSLIWLGVIDERIGQYARGCAELDRAIELAQALGLSVSEADALEVRGLCLLRLGRLDESLDDLTGSLDLRRRHQSGLNIPDSLLSLGRYHEHCGEPERALDYFRQALEAADDTDHPPPVICALTGIGETLTALGRAESALTHFPRALALAEQVNDPYLLARAQEGFGRALGATGAPTEDARTAVEYLRQAKDAYLRLGVPDAARIEL